MTQCILLIVLLLIRLVEALNDCDNCHCCKNGPSRCKPYSNYQNYCLDRCLDGYFGETCTHACNQSLSNCLTCSDRTKCTRCSDGSYKNGQYCYTCPNRCLTCFSNTYCYSCKEGYYSGRYLDNAHNSHNDCRHKCQDQCKTCTSYNTCTACPSRKYGITCKYNCGIECKDRKCDIRTGACDQCPDGFYGYYCNSKCSVGCSVNICSRDGECQTCTTGFTGKKCDQCSIGKYGENCNKTCPRGCSNDNCDKNGFCYSCKSVFTGSNCNHCVSGFYGYDCNYECLDNCKTCDSENSCSTCNDKYWIGNNKCHPCPSKCARCTSDIECSLCDPFFYGQICNANCPKNCKDGKCDRTSGVCLSCDGGYHGDLCDASCPENCAHNVCNQSGKCTPCADKGYYDDTCSTKCPDNCIGCNQDTGSCVKCLNGYFGESCEKKCPLYCKQGAPCERTNGYCTKCPEGYFLPNSNCYSRCNTNCKTCEYHQTYCTACANGKYGKQNINNKYFHCFNACPTNCLNKSCDGILGDCEYGCERGYWGKKCDNECPTNCVNNECFNNGTCLSGCMEGYTGYNCECPINCECDADGKCFRCKSGFEDVTKICTCCLDGFYGKMCDQKCGTNCVNTTCKKQSGDCVHGCKTGYTGTSCAIAAEQMGANEGSMGVKIGASAGGGLFIVIIIIVIVAVLLLRRRQRNEKRESSVMVEGNDNTDHSTVTYSEINTSGLPLQQIDPDAVYAMPNKPKKNVDRVKSSDKSSSAQTVSNPNCAKPSTNNDGIVKKENGKKALIVKKPAHVNVHDNAAIRTSIETRRSAINTDESALEIEEDVDSILASSKAKSVILEDGLNISEPDTYYNVTAVKRRRITLASLPDFVSKKSKAEFVKEFKQLPPGLIKPYVDSQKRVNLSKNRYKGIYPYDGTRVLLKEGDSDYINASFIDGYNKRKAHIASIGPTYRYMGDMSAFWIMVWQEKVGKIVMLTKLDEGGTPKCDQYWPEKDFSFMYANIQVTCESEEVYADYTVRSFALQKDSEKRKICQVHFTAWPDKGTPDDVTSVIEFRQKVISTKTKLEGPLLVHCSAGIGRTGTYIALDSLTEEGEAEGKVDIFAFVRNMREQRVNMVQTAEQYQYLHTALVHTLTFDSKAVEASRFEEYMKSHTDEHLREKFEKLQASVEQRSDDEIEAVKRNQSLRNKNRDGADIPGDRNRPRLYLERKPGSIDYINAVYVNSYTTTNRYLVAQTPMTDTVVDFLTLIVQEKVSCIVSMETNSVDDKTIGAYYPAENQTLKKGTFTVKCEDEKDTEQYMLRKLEILHKGKSGTEEIKIPHIQFTHWNANKNIPEEPAKFVQFVQNVEVKCGGNKSKGPILVHCLTGAEKSCLFCVVSNLLEKTQIDQETSVVNAVRQIKYRRHMAIPNKEQYIFCHQCVNEYLRTFDIYSNFGLKR